MATQTAPLRIDIVSDVVCPWCVIGYLQLRAALESTQSKAEIYWHPFELNPDMPPEGQNLRAHLAEKYGTTAEDSAKARDHLARLGAELGFTFNYGDDMRMYNTFDSHRLLHWAESQGKGHALNLALFAAFFTDGRDVSDHAVLIAAAKETGLDGEAAKQVLSSAEYGPEVRARETFWQEQGIRGVPAMILERRHLVTGAQGAEAYGDILNRLKEMRAA